MHRGRRTTVALSLGLLLTPGLGGCGSDGPPPGPHQAATPRPDPRADAAPLLTRLITRMDQQGSVRSTVQGKLGLVGDLNGAGTVRYRGTQADVSLGGDAKTSDNEPKRDIELSIVDGVGYLKSPLLVTDTGKPWIRVAPNGHDAGAQILGPALEQLKHTTDPREAFAGIEHATRIQSSAPDQVDGRPTTRYDLRVLTARAAEITTDPQQRARMRAAAQHGQQELEYQLWVDSSGLPARFTAIGESVHGQISLTSFYRDWGLPTDIQPPPAELVGMFPDMPGGQGPH